MDFLKTQRRIDAIESFIDRLKNTVDISSIPIEESAGRIVSEELISSIDIPSFSRSTVDGYACVSTMTSGASHNNPIPFEFGGELSIGEKVEGKTDRNKVYYIPTGAAVPDEFDSVVMIEDCEKVNDTVYIEKTVFRGENVIYKGEDVMCGNKIVGSGAVLRSVDVGILASQGIENLKVFNKVRIGIIPTGKELKRHGEKLTENSIYDINSYMLGALFSNYNYFDTRIFDVIRDDEKMLEKTIRENYDDFDVFIVSGGSSKGIRDITVNVIEHFGEPGVLTHGINMSPGKPTILSLCSDKIIFGSPGHPVSSYISVRFVMIPILNAFAGRKEIFERTIGSGEIAVDIPSKHGIDEFIRIKVDNEKLVPIFGNSGMISTLSKSDGIVIVENEREGLYKGTKIDYYGVL